MVASAVLTFPEKAALDSSRSFSSPLGESGSRVEVPTAVPGFMENDWGRFSIKSAVDRACFFVNANWSGFIG